MRSTTEIQSIVDDAKINYSYRIQLYEGFKERGAQKEVWNILFSANNIFDCFDDRMLSLTNQSLLCDWLTRNEFILNENYLLFTESVFTEQGFDTL